MSETAIKSCNDEVNKLRTTDLSKTPGSPKTGIQSIEAFLRFHEECAECVPAAALRFTMLRNAVEVILSRDVAKRLDTVGRHGDGEMSDSCKIHGPLRNIQW